MSIVHTHKAYEALSHVRDLRAEHNGDYAGLGIRIADALAKAESNLVELIRLVGMDARTSHVTTVDTPYRFGETA